MPAQKFVVWKSAHSIGKFTMSVDDPNAVPPRPAWKDRNTDQKHVADVIALVKTLGSLGEQSVWVIDDKELSKTYQEIGKQMFTKKFCTGKDSANGGDPASEDEIRAWVMTQKREVVCGNHTIAAARTLKSRHPTNKIFRTLIVDIWIVDSSITLDTNSVEQWASWDNHRSALTKVTNAMERIASMHQTMKDLCYFVSVKLNQFGDIVKPHGYFAELNKKWMENFKVKFGSIHDYLQIAKCYGDEWEMLVQIMARPAGKKSKGDTAAYFHVGSRGIPRAMRMALWSRYLQGQIDTKQLKACYIEIKQTRALQGASLKIANKIAFLNKKDWTAWVDLVAALPKLTQLFIEQERTGFKISRSKNAESDDVSVCPPAYKETLIRMCQVQQNENKKDKESRVRESLFLVQIINTSFFVYLSIFFVLQSLCVFLTIHFSLMKNC